ncbi:IS1096 element passenger TnpR family protein [Methanocella sp. MCL-LM]|uniref:IS1096 element passenger TnpR family protein n=1 Tax=Methanocella sp. MCL-LM TaxID=3412035 RepID=UPI003C711DFC
MPGLDSDNPDHVYQLKAHIYNLNHVWRRFHIGTDSSLEQLRRTIMCLFDLHEDFPCEFRAGRARYGSQVAVEGEAAGPESVDLALVPVRDAVETVKKETARNRKSIFFSYESPEYRESARPRSEPASGDEDEEEEEGGDIPGFTHWYIVISYEDELPAAAGQSYPVCIAGERASPPGAIHNYDQYQWLTNNMKTMGRSRFIDVLKRGNHPDDAGYIRLLEDGFDPALFNLDTVNLCLSKAGKK